MSGGHTPGPWDILGSVSLMNLDVVYGSGRIAMMECENDEISDGELFANAALIAAAPDLLAALVELDAWAMNESGADYPNGTFEIVRAALRKAGVA
jgi:hypothetical protein